MKNFLVTVGYFALTAFLIGAAVLLFIATTHSEAWFT